MSEHDARERYGLYRLCECPECEGRGQVTEWLGVTLTDGAKAKCPECRGEGRTRQCVAECGSPEAVGVALVTLGREGEWEGCAFGLLDRAPECEWCDGGRLTFKEPCRECKGSGVKSTGTWIVLPWLPSARNVRDAARTLARSRNRPGGRDIVMTSTGKGDPMTTIRTIRKNTREATAILANATRCKAYRLSNNFVGEDVEPKYAIAALMGNDFAKLTERDGVYCVRVHDNLWYELAS